MNEISEGKYNIKVNSMFELNLCLNVWNELINAGI